MYRLLKWGAVALAVLVAAVVLAVLLLDWNMLRGPIAARVEAATGREFAIEGDLRGELSLRPWMRLRDVRLGNAEWASDPDMVQVEEVAVRLDLRELIQGKLVVSEVRIVGAEVSLEVDQEGRANWNIGEAPGVPAERSDVPFVENVTIEQSRLKLRDAQRDIQLDADIASAEVVSPEEGELPVNLEGEGRIQGRPFFIAAKGGSIARLREPQEPYPVELEIAVGLTEMQARGTLTAPLALGGVDVELHITGPTPDELAPVLNIALPSTAPYDLTGRLRREGGTWRFDGFEGTVGDSDLAGSLSVEAERERPLILADLVSRRLDFADLGTLIGLPPDPAQVVETAEEGEPARILPDAPLQLQQVRQTDAEVTFRGEQVLAPGLPMQDVELILELKDGVLELKPVWFGFAGGQLTLFLSIYSTAEPVQTDYDLRLENVQLQSIFAEAGLEGSAEGVLEGRVRFSTLGNSVRRAMATAEGQAAIIMNGGQVTGSLLQLLDAGYLEALAVVLSDGVPGDMPIRCFVAAFDIQDGQLRTSPLLLDTEDSVITGEGVIDLGNESFGLEIGGEPKDPGIASSRIPIVIGGTFASPSFQVDPTEAAVRGGLAAGLGALVAPLAAVIPFLDLGLAEDTPCAQLVGEAQSAVEEE